MHLSEKIKSSAGGVLMVGIIAAAVLFVSTFALSSWRTGQAQISQQKLDGRASATEAGRFAVENFIACKKAGGALNSPPADARCIAETVSGAEKFKGTEFGGQVAHKLADWLTQSKALHTQ